MTDKQLSRKELKALLQCYEIKNNPLAIRLFIFDYGLFFIGQWASLVLPLYLKPFASVIIFISIGRLFILGHDACHGSFTNNKKLNQFIGRLAFLPALTPFATWAFGHNSIHHGFSNLVNKKDMWSPLSLSCYKKLDSIQQLFYRLYRNRFGVGAYYFIEIWWKNLFFPSYKIVGKDAAKKFQSDSIVVASFLVTWLFSLYVLAQTLNQTVSETVLFAFLLPFVMWNFLMGFLIYLHHTHPNVRWYKDEEEWMNSKPYISAVVHVKFPQWVSTALHHIMEHPTHHLNSNIPCYNLKSAQQKLEELLPEHIVVQDFSWKWYLECTRICKLYDFEKHEWVIFQNNFMNT